MTNPRHLPPSPVEERKMPNANPADMGSVDLPPLELPLPDRDMRAKRPPVLSFLLRWSTLRRAARVVSLLALDLAAIILAIFTALCLKAAVRDAWDPSVLLGAVQGLRAVRVPGRLAAVRALGAVRGARRSGPGLTRIVASLFQTTLVALIFARRQRRGASPATTSSTARCSSRSPTSRPRALPTSRRRARCCSARRLQAPRGPRRHRRADRGRRPRAAGLGRRTRRSRSSASSR